MIDEIEVENDVICDNSIHRSMITVGDYLREYSRINQQIVALEIQINMLKKNAERYGISSFDSSLHQMNYELYLRKKEISPIIMIITRTVSMLIPNGDGEMFYERFFLGRSSLEIARQHGLTDNYVTRTVGHFLKVAVPDEVVDECGKIFTE